MKNQLIPLCLSPSDDSVLQPSLREHGTRSVSLETELKSRGGRFRFLPRWDGLVRECGGLPIVELPYPEDVCAVLNPSSEVLAGWEKACGRS